MTGIQAALWGLFGGFAVEGLDLYTAVRRGGRWPWRVGGPREVGAAGYFVAELFRLIIGGGLAWAAAASGQVTTPAGALAVGVAAHLIVERLAQSVSLPHHVRDVPGGDAEPVPSRAQQYLTYLTAEELDGQRGLVKGQQACTDEAAKISPQGDQTDRVGD